MARSPSIAPNNANATTVACSGNAPRNPSATRPPLTGTTSATVIQSMPSMKLTRLTNQIVPMNSRNRSIHHGKNVAMRRSWGRAAITMTAASACSSRRGATGIRWVSAPIPTATSNAVAASTQSKWMVLSESTLRVDSTNAKVTPMVAAITAMPPPCGVALTCDERALAWASTWRRSSGSNATVKAALASNANTSSARALAEVKLCTNLPPWSGRRPSEPFRPLPHFDRRPAEHSGSRPKAWFRPSFRLLLLGRHIAFARPAVHCTQTRSSICGCAVSG